MILQLDPPIPLNTPKGRGLAHIVIDYGVEHHLLWTVFIDDTGECWTFDNTKVRAVANITMDMKRGDFECRRCKTHHRYLLGGLCNGCSERISREADGGI